MRIVLVQFSVLNYEFSDAKVYCAFLNENSTSSVCVLNYESDAVANYCIQLSFHTMRIVLVQFSVLNSELSDLPRSTVHFSPQVCVVEAGQGLLCTTRSSHENGY
ncbi:hypothetical protein TNCV_3140171 [Trichonephila clavipes]|nr:hypothetical protein TNCV_3140171 [Trichonephila clavipes]